MKRKKRQKRNPPHSILTGPFPVDLETICKTVSYTGSPYHKNSEWWGGKPEKRSYPASLCPEFLHENRENIERWLREGVEKGAVSKFHHNGQFPKRIWYKQGEVVYEAILENPTQGTYHGYPLIPEEWPEGIEKLFEND